VSESALIDVAIGLVLIFVVFSVAVSKLNELVLGMLNYRGRQLETALIRLVDGSPPVPEIPSNDVVAEPTAVLQPPKPSPVHRQLLDGPLAGLLIPARTGPRARTTPPARVGTTVKYRLPSYISADSFARGVLDLLGSAPRSAFDSIDRGGLPASALAAYDECARVLNLANAQALQAAVARAKPPAGQEAKVDALVLALQHDRVDSAKATVSHWPESPLKTKLLAVLHRVGLDQDAVRAELITWFDDAMARFSGGYKRRVQLFLAGYAVVLTLVFNVDTIAVTQSFWHGPTVRAAAVAAADSVLANGGVIPPAESCAGSVSNTAQSDICSAAAAAKAGIDDAKSLQIPLGWQDTPDDAQGWLVKLLGWLITVFGLSFGAPFWFDVLGKVVNMRSSGPKPVGSA
jgi:hypothetical protein